MLLYKVYLTSTLHDSHYLKDQRAAPAPHRDTCRSSHHKGDCAVGFLG